MKVIIVSPYALPELGANTLRVNSFVSYFKEHRVKIKVLAPKRGVPDVGVVTRYDGIFTLMRYIIKSDYDTVIFTSPPLTHGFFSGIAALLSGKNFFVDLRDPWPSEYEKLGIYSGYSLKLLIYKILEIFTYFLARKIFVVTDGIKEHVCKKGFCNKVVLARNGTTSIFSYYSKERKLLRKKLNISNKTILFTYSGSFIGWEVDELIKRFKKMPKNYTLLLLISNREEYKGAYDKLKQMAQKMLRKRMRVVDIKTMPMEQLSAYFSASDVGISTVPSDMNYCIVVKTYDYTATGLFVVAKGPQKGSLRNLFSEYSIGKYVDNWDDFEKIKIEQREISNLQRKKRVSIARNNFDRKVANKIVFDEIIKHKKH